jgi:hypothetical protein
MRDGHVCVATLNIMCWVVQRGSGELGAVSAGGKGSDGVADGSDGQGRGGYVLSVG